MMINKIVFFILLLSVTFSDNANSLSIVPVGAVRDSVVNGSPVVIRYEFKVKNNTDNSLYLTKSSVSGDFSSLRRDSTGTNACHFLEEESVTPTPVQPNGSCNIVYKTNVPKLPVNVDEKEFLENIKVLSQTGEEISFNNWGLTVYKEEQRWRKRSQGLPATFIVRKLVNVNGVIYAAGFAGIYKTEDGGAHWIFAGNGLPSEAYGINVSSLLNVRGVLYVGIRNGSNVPGVYKSTDGGIHWKSAGYGVPAHVASLLSVNGTLYAGLASIFSNASLYKSTDGGANWSASSSGLESAMYIYALTNDNGILFAGGVNPSETQYIYKSIDAAVHWTPAGTGINSYIYTLLSVNGTLFAGGDTVYKSTDAGSNWVRTNLNLPGSSSVESLTYINGIVYAGVRGEAGLYMSTNAGVSWLPVGIGLPSDVTINTLITVNGVLFAGGSKGVWAEF